MGTLGTAWGKPEDSLMAEKKDGITPYRMGILMEVAAKTAKVMTTGAWNLTFDEMEMVIVLIRFSCQWARRKNE